MVTKVSFGCMQVHYRPQTSSPFCSHDRLFCGGEPSNRKMDLDEVSANDGFVPISVNAPALGQLLADHWTKEGAAFLPPHFF